MSEKSIGYTDTGSFRCLEDIEKAYTISSGSMLRLCYCGAEECEPGWRFGPYVRENYVIHVVTGGRGVFAAGGKEYILSKGSMFAIYPGEETIYEADREDPWSYIWIGFNGREAENVVREIGFLRDKPVIMLEETEGIEAAVERILDSRQLTFAAAMKRVAGLYDILSLMMEQCHEEDRETMSIPEDRYVNAAVEIIAESYAERIRIAEVADRLGINRSYLSSIFKRRMHMSPQEFLINLRLEKAAQMLRDTKDPVGDIAAMVGYTDALAFSKAFKKKYGETPSDFRNTSPQLEKIGRKGGYTSTLNL